MQNKPILFIGSIEDVSTLDDNNYLLRVERNIFTSFSHLFLTELALELNCSKTKVDSLMGKNKKLFSDFGLNNGVAFIAQIEQIKSDFYLGKEGNKEEIKIGIGNCLDLIYTGRVRITHSDVIQSDNKHK